MCYRMGHVERRVCRRKLLTDKHIVFSLGRADFAWIGRLCALISPSLLCQTYLPCVLIADEL
jgi:hypothetical protein